MASRFRLSPWSLALIILLALVGAYIAYSYWNSRVEAFASLTAADCQKLFSQCSSSSVPPFVCQTNLNSCLAAAPPAPPTPAPTPAVDPTAGCKTRFSQCSSSSIPPFVCQTNLNSCLAAAGAPPAPAPAPLPTVPLPTVPTVPTVPTPPVVPKPINPAILTGPTPSAAQVSAAQNNYWIDSSGERHLLEKDSSGNRSWFQRYTPSTTIVRPTYMPPATPLQTLTASSPTDIGTGAQSILNGAPITPSLRQMIRKDIAGAVKDEFGELQNQYQIQYMYQ